MRSRHEGALSLMPVEPDHPYEIVDVFTDRALTGNALAVFTLAELIPSRLMQAIARELHLSETVFVLPGDGDCDVRVRIFTPEAELPFAGHPILGTAFVVGERDGHSTVRLGCEVGVVPVALTREHGEIVSGEMEQPIPVVSAFDRTDALLAALGITEADVELPVECYVNGPAHLIVVLRSPDLVRDLEPDMVALRNLGECTISCCAIVGGDDPDGSRAPVRVADRVFAPLSGVLEDPATGSAAGPLALHLVRHGRARAGQTVEIAQGVEISRPSRLLARIEGPSESPTGVLVSGSAVFVARGEFRIQ